MKRRGEHAGTGPDSRHVEHPSQADAVVTSRSVNGPRLLENRDSGEAWVEGPHGQRWWGRYGAAGVLVYHPEAGALLQHRATWSHHGDTWGVPGGALHAGESPLDGACREAEEEAGVARDNLIPVASVVADREVWAYTTVVARATTPFPACATDAESHELRWIPIDAVAGMPLHPGFAAAWPLHRHLLAFDRTVVIDVANVMGSVPDGWWRDRKGAAERLLAHIATFSVQGCSAAHWGEAWPMPDQRMYGDGHEEPGLRVRVLPRVVAVVEGEARAAVCGAGGLTVVRAATQGDDAIVDVVVNSRTESTPNRGQTLVVTADRELRRRIAKEGARAVGPTWLTRCMEPSS